MTCGLFAGGSQAAGPEAGQGRGARDPHAGAGAPAEGAGGEPRQAVRHDRAHHPGRTGAGDRPVLVDIEPEELGGLARGRRQSAGNSGDYATGFTDLAIGRSGSIAFLTRGQFALYAPFRMLGGIFNFFRSQFELQVKSFLSKKLLCIFFVVQHELKEVEDKFRKAMITNAQLDNDKASQTYQLELLKDR